MSIQLEPGQILDRYTLEACIGTGGMASVYRVRHNALDSVYALKVLHMGGPALRERLMQEGRVQARLRHPNIVSVTDVLDVDGSLGLLMEYVDGAPMDRWLTEHRPGLEQALGLFDGILSGVTRAHREGLVHRDLKPANVLLDRVDGRLVPKVADFGLVKALDEDSDTRTTRTRSGMAMGTPAYMAPEQIRDASRVDHRADIFSLGCILYELVTGKRPFEGGDMMDTFTAITTGDYVAPERVVAGLDPVVARTISACLMVNPAARPQTCDEVRGMLYGPDETRALPSIGDGGAGTMHSITGAELPSQGSLESDRPRATSRLLAVGAVVLLLATAAAVRTATQPASPTSPPDAAPVSSPSLPGPPAGPPAVAPDPVPSPPASPVVATAPATPPSARAEPRSTSATTAVRSPAVAAPTAPAAAPTLSNSPSPPVGSYSVTGEARSVYLESGAGRFRAGEPAPAGTYTVYALFSGTVFVPAGQASITDGGATVLDCIAAFTMCTAR